MCKFYVNAYLQRQNQKIFTKLIGNEGVAFFYPIYQHFLSPETLKASIFSVISVMQ